MQNLHVLSVVIRQDGDIIAEHNFEKAKPTLLWSASKTLVSFSSKEPIVFEPGIHFLYNNAATYMISKLISITTGYNLKEYLMTRIFKLLGIPELQ